MAISRVITELSEEQKREAFRSDLAALLNRYSMESRGGDTPDFILADYLIGCLDTFNATMQRRESWYGRGKEEGPVEVGVPHG